ncbi:unnamed protein product [Paramecium octaurelia]|uniref:Uncharacterized protein n=1 Tax=Paramecium octaurelia TaxID=43137 RepID=A0A8S1W8C4_PAROT|nr:unnamed protein product [Paramecium octaurelia]
MTDCKIHGKRNQQKEQSLQQVAVEVEALKMIMTVSAKYLHS